MLSLMLCNISYQCINLKGKVLLSIQIQELVSEENFRFSSQYSHLSVSVLHTFSLLIGPNNKFLIYEFL